MPGSILPYHGTLQLELDQDEAQAEPGDEWQQQQQQQQRGGDGGDEEQEEQEQQSAPERWRAAERRSAVWRSAALRCARRVGGTSRGGLDGGWGV